MKKEDNNIFISQGVRPIWQRLVAATSFTAALFCLYVLYKSGGKEIGEIAYITTTLIMVGIRFSLVKNYHFNFDKGLFKIESCVGPVKWGKWNDFKNLKYVAIFLNGKDLYEINLWYDKNKHFNISNFWDYEDASHTATNIAKKMKLDLWDASDPRNGYWVELDT